MQFEFLDCYHNLFSPSMAKKSSKCPSTVESSQTGCVWNFGGIFDHYHRPHRKLLLDESHGSQSLPGAGHETSQIRMLTFDEQLRSINMKSKKKSTSLSHFLKRETGSTNHARKKDDAWKKTMEKSFWKKMKSRYENANKKKESTNVVDRIVILKPLERVVECPVDVGCRCLLLHPHQNSTSKQHIVKHTHDSFNNVTQRFKNSKKLKNFRMMKSCDEDDETGYTTENLALVPYSKHQEPEVFIEARRHLAERLRLVAMATGVGAGDPSSSSCKQVSRTLERILLASPIHESITAFEREPEGTHSEISLQKTWNGSSPLKPDEYSSASGFVEIIDTNDFLTRDSKFADIDSDPNNRGPSPSGANQCIAGPQLEYLLDVSSPKAGCKSENVDNDQFRENPSPVSVLDSFFSDNISSPTSTPEAVERHLQPRRLDFEEHSSQTSSPQRITSLSLFPEDRGFISSYVNEVYQTAQSNWDDFFATDYLLESSCDHKVLYDFVKEVLVSLHSRITLFSARLQPFSLEKDLIDKVIDHVDWHNGQVMGPRTLDHLVRRDLAKCGSWLDTSSDTDDIVAEVADEIMQELVIEAIHDIYF